MNSLINGVWQRDGVLGSGSFAVVWRARHAVSGELAAVKEINLARLSSKLQSSLASEVSVLKRTNHKNLVALLDIAQEGEERLYLVLEYCGGGDLGHFLRRNGRVSEATTQHLLVQLAEGLKALRSQNLVHRDLKPQNLLLTDNTLTPHLKIADFGFARNLQPQGLAETLCGSPLYMAPEILQLHKYNAKADLWSVGAIMFELLTGKPPFNGVNHLQLLQNIERGEGGKLPPDVAAALSPACKHLLHQLLRRNPLERISYEEFFAHPFLTQLQLTHAPTLLASSGQSTILSATRVTLHAAATQQQQQGPTTSPVAGTAGLAASGLLRPHLPQQPRVAVTGPLLGVHEATGISVHTAVMQKPAGPQLPGGSQQPATAVHATTSTSSATGTQQHAGLLGTELEYTDIDLGPPPNASAHTPLVHLHAGGKHETTPGGLSVIEEVDDYVVVSTDPSPTSSPTSSMVGAAAQTGGRGAHGGGGGSSATASQVLGASWAGSRGRGAWDALSRMGPALLPPRLVASAASQLRNAAAASSHGVNQWVAPLGQLAAHVTQHVTPNRAGGSDSPSNSNRGSPAGYSGARSPAGSRPVSAGEGTMQHPKGVSGSKPHSSSTTSNSVTGQHVQAKAASSAGSSSNTSAILGKGGQKSGTNADETKGGSTLGAEQLAQLVRVPEVTNPLDLVQRVLLVLVEMAVKGWDAALLEAEVACESRLAHHAIQQQQAVHEAAQAPILEPGSARSDRSSSPHLSSTEIYQQPATASANLGPLVARTVSSPVKTTSGLQMGRQSSASVAGASSSPRNLVTAAVAMPVARTGQQELDKHVAVAVAQAASAAAQVLRRAAAEFVALHLLCSQLLHAALQATDQQQAVGSAADMSRKPGGQASQDHSAGLTTQRTAGTGLLPASPHAGSPPSGGLQPRSLLAAHARSVLAPLQERAPAVCAQLLHDQQLPDPAQLLYCVAGRLSRTAAMDEVMGQYSGSVQQYAKAADLLLLLLTAGSSTWGVLHVLPHEQVQQAHTLYVVLRIRQAACMADLNAQLHKATASHTA